ncbi:peptidase S58 [Dictyobacter alpinus]|uniref:Peptidase S58 n=1 Tax=Dictyobacter alpinus TaxID=2014873 RepID=A0A402B8T3_9CHLR|nr:P1 family peptidase [Dictyobacter alpinus]GCE27755.1 peptidase S58 [Dictyobacter alpinus]
MFDDITDVPGIRVGHDTNLEAGTGCTVVLCETPAVGGVDVRGGAPATRETDLLHPLCMVDEVNAVLLTGGSAFGLDAASGVVRYLEERGVGYDTGVVRVPIVPAAAIFDLPFGSATIRPDSASGYQACKSAETATGPLEQGTIGGGTGATVGKMLGPDFAMKGGVGSASQELIGGIIVGAIVLVNALGDIIDLQTQQVVAGTRNAAGKSSATNNPFGNTTIAVIATNATLTKAEATKVAQMAHDGMAHVIRPAHTMFDGDTVFTLALGDKTSGIQHDTATAAQHVSTLGAAAAHTLARAIVKAVRQASELHNIPAASSLL